MSGVGRARFGGRSSFKSWLFAVIRRTAQGQRRQANVRRWLLARWSGGEPRRPPPASPEERIQNSERAVWFRSTLSALSRRQRQVLELVFYHDLTVREAAEVLGLSIGTVRVHYDRGKKELLRRLEQGASR
ncbi:MAG: RNA polymerase sigma factor [Thermoanaerobaculia bacterium]